MKQVYYGAALGLIMLVTACDAVRLPGDGRTPPDPQPAIPDGAPAPPPPSEPVLDPYGDGAAEDAEQTEIDAEVPSTDAPEAEIPVAPEPTEDAPAESGTAEEDDSATDTLPETGDTEAETEGPTPAPDSPSDPGDTSEGDVTPEPEPEPEPLPVKFQYYAPGELFPGSGIGNRSDIVYAPDMIFPIADAPTYLNTQVWGYGGAMGPGGDGQCDARNYQFPWQDNFCETRSSTKRATLCSETKVHQGQDLRAGDRAGCLEMVRGRPAKPTLYKIVAAEDGVIAYIGRFYVQLRGTESGNIYNYVHINMEALQVSVGDTVTGGQHLGYLSDDFGGTPTTYHLHFEIKAPLEGLGISHVPPYMSLVRAYERREQGRGELIEPDTFIGASVPILPEGLEILE